MPEIQNYETLKKKYQELISKLKRNIWVLLRSTWKRAGWNSKKKLILRRLKYRIENRK